MSKFVILMKHEVSVGYVIMIISIPVISFQKQGFC